MSAIRTGLFLAVGLFVFAALVAGSPSKSVHAEHSEPSQGTVTISKHCEDELGNPVAGEFDILFDVTIGFIPILTDIQLGTLDQHLVNGNLDDVFDIETTVVCNAEGEGEVVLNWSELAPTLGDPGELDDLIEFITNVCVFGPCDEVIITITEVTDMAGVTSTVSAGCTIDALDEDNWDEFTEFGLLCEIENIFDNPDVRVTKVCQNGAGTGTFLVTVDGQSTAIPCGITAPFPNVGPGLVSISEVIGGTDTYLTIIACAVNGTLIVSQPGLATTLDLDFGDDANCAIFNTLVTAGVTPPPPTIPEIINIINVPVTVVQANTQTQNQTNNQAQVNDQAQNQTNSQTNDQDTNVTATGGSATGGSGTGGTGTGGGGGSANVNTGGASAVAGSGTITPPKAGDAGLAGSNGTSTSLFGLGLVGLLTLSLAAAARFGRVSI